MALSTVQALEKLRCVGYTWKTM